MRSVYVITISAILVCISGYIYAKRRSNSLSSEHPVNSNHTNNHSANLSNKTVGKYKGLVLFDIDGTLTSGRDNYNVVQYCIDHGWAVGICTAGAIYNMNNLLMFSWMPRNLWYFIREHDNITFNNIASGILQGKMNKNAYNSIISKYYTENNTEDRMLLAGYLKGFALVETGKLLGIHDPRRLVLCDDLSSFIQGVSGFNPTLTTVCAGEDCGGSLSINSIQKVIHSE